MKIIDLLNKIANGEKIEYSHRSLSSIYDELTITDFLLQFLDVNYADTEDDTNWLNDEVEIIKMKTN